MRVLLSGGGTAGHIYPALTVAGRLVAEGHEVAFVGTPDGLEARLVPEAGIAFHGVKASGFDRARPLTALTASLTLIASALRAVRTIATFRPDVVLGFGGYVSLPVGFAAVMRRVPLVLHEQNSVPGLANRVLSRWADAVGVTYPDSVGRLRHPERVSVTGNPVRQAVLEADRDRGRAMLGLGPSDTVVLVFGGSRGARHINDAFVALAGELMRPACLRVVHVAGRIEAASVTGRIDSVLGEGHSRYRVVEYIDGMGDAIAAADIVVARAGATSIAEITTIGRASVLIPYPYATDDHQTLNARTIAAAGGAIVIPDSEIDGPSLREALENLVADGDRRAKMAEAARALAHRDATDAVVELALAHAARGRETR